jgi:DNA invertase Pin-like site-specific DNA recombinase
MQAIIYAARSKDEADGKDSTGDQVKAIRKGIPKDRTVVGEPHVDHASGFSGNRGPGLDAAIAAAIAASPSELWVFHSSRLARGSGMKEEARSLMEVLAQLRRAGVAVRSVEDDAFLTNPMLWGVVDQMAHKYSADLSAHVRKGKRAAYEKGRWAGGRYVPDGYRLGDAGGLVIDEPRAAIVRRAAELLLEGLTFNAVARHLTAEGHRTQDGKPWRGARVKGMLSHPIYAGKVVWRYREPGGGHGISAAEARARARRRYSPHLSGGDERAHQRDRLRFAELLLADQRFPRGERDRVAEGGSGASVEIILELSTGHQHLAHRGEVAVEGGEPVLHDRHRRLVTEQVLEHALHSRIEAVELRERRAQALVGARDARPGGWVRRRVLRGPVGAAGVEQCGLIRKMAIDGRASNPGAGGDGADRGP